MTIATMTTFKHEFILTTPLLVSTVVSYAQTFTSKSGGEVPGKGGTVSFSVGQVTYQTYSGTNGRLSEGVQQPYEISVLTGVSETIGVNLAISAYSNPVTNNLILTVEDFNQSMLDFQLYNTNGKILLDKKMTESETLIDIGEYKPAIYFLNVISNNQSINTRH